MSHETNVLCFSSLEEMLSPYCMGTILGVSTFLTNSQCSRKTTVTTTLKLVMTTVALKNNHRQPSLVFLLSKQSTMITIYIRLAVEVNIYVGITMYHTVFFGVPYHRSPLL